ncbi:RNA polymerase II transcriptional coactivator KIWI-like isoform X2 [Chenopodium quinoa]|uniref:RNA polymerase II transcriptional coactivator KIWI-like isoform X2 n=1 Tax=Chenopodium quinoa TaxID=63459 RepID=UPI000B77FA1E|nr:RNA polymerase II transcriptional coactivator KIWI-like isoform X2 [Chenopodium quinoa]
MSGKFKRKGDDNHASDADSDGNAPPKKSAKSNDDEDGIVVCEISKNRRVSVRSWQGKVMVDIREFYVKDGKQMPGRKGIFI